MPSRHGAQLKKTYRGNFIIDVEKNKTMDSPSISPHNCQISWDNISK